MRYISAADIDRRVDGLWKRYGLRPRFDVERLVDSLDLGLLWIELAPYEGFAVAAELVPAYRKICVNEALLWLFEANRALLRFTLAHEVGHWVLHRRVILSGSLREARAESGSLTCRRADLEPTERHRTIATRLEYQANMFASRLLAPSDTLRSLVARYGCDGWRAIYSIAHALEISPSALCVRLQQEGLMYRDESGVPRPGAAERWIQQSLAL